MKLLDLFCGAGGAATGYYRAGFTDITGIDNKPMPRYPFKFIQADALEYLTEHGREYDVIHASPPCQRFSKMQNIHKNKNEHPNLIDDTRELLKKTTTYWIIENVVGAPLKASIMLCGTMFGLPIIRHRYFECSWDINPFTLSCNHSSAYDPWHGNNRTASKYRESLGIDWMPIGGGGRIAGSINEAIPPAYTEYIGKQLMCALASLNAEAAHTERKG